MGKGLNPNRAKIHRSYTVEEVADLFNVHKNTVRAWLKKGLDACDDRHPTLILGSVLREFIRTKKTKHQQKCQPWEFYCVRCRKPKFPAEGIADYEAQTATKGRLIALCPTCETLMNKYSSLAQLEKLKEKLEISLPKTLEHINKRDKPLLNSDFKY